MTNKLLGNIGAALMSLFVIVIDILIIGVANDIHSIGLWCMLMCVPATITPVVIHEVITRLGLTRCVKQFFMNIFN